MHPGSCCSKYRDTSHDQPGQNNETELHPNLLPDRTGLGGPGIQGCRSHDFLPNLNQPT